MDKSVIYHYCSPEVFDLIIRNSTIRLSNLDKTNDYMEKEWGSRLIENVLNNELKKEGINIDLRKPYFYSDNCLCHMEYLMESFLYQKKKQTLVSCMSLAEDDLGQWRAYGQDGYGLAIGFNYAKMGRIFNVHSPIAIQKVICKKENQEKELINKAIIPAMYYMKKLFVNHTFRNTDNYDKYFEEEFDTFTEVIEEPLARVVSYIKNPAFISENEVRLIYQTNIANCFEEEEQISEACRNKIEIGGKGQFVLNSLDYQFRNNNLISYADLSFEKIKRDGIIKEVIIGPKSNISLEDLQYYLVKNGYGIDVSIRKSKASYR